MDTGLRILRNTSGIRPVLQEKPGIKDWCRAFPLGSVQPQVVMGDAAPQGEENLQAVRIGRDAFLNAFRGGFQFASLSSSCGFAVLGLSRCSASRAIHSLTMAILCVGRTT